MSVRPTRASSSTSTYATGDMAFKLGLIPGSGMTCEAAVAKLSYLASLDLTYQDIKKHLLKNLRETDWIRRSAGHEERKLRGQL